MADTAARTTDLPQDNPDRPLLQCTSSRKAVENVMPNILALLKPKPVESGMRMNSYFTRGASISSGAGTSARNFSGSVR
jgi:hypothetical protein